MNSKGSFTSADSLPVKLLRNANLVDFIVRNGKIPPIHAQILPTNACNLTCSFCSCSEEDRTLEMDSNDILYVMRSLGKLGTRSITITGGGEPLLSPHIGLLIFEAYRRGIKVGLVTNGTVLDRLTAESANRLTWCRISSGDDRGLSVNQIKEVRRAVFSAPKVGWAFSYVVSPTPNIARILDHIWLAQELRFTHIRLVADLLQPDNVPMAELKKALALPLADVKVPVIFQARNEPQLGKNCRIGSLKPVVGPDMRVYACCGVQYAQASPAKKLPEELSLGTFEEFIQNAKENSTKKFENAKYCKTCYYSGYNEILDVLCSKVQHEEFV